MLWIATNRLLLSPGRLKFSQEHSRAQENRMSELLQRCSQEETLRHIEKRLSQGVAPAVIIKEMLPNTRDGALSWGRRLAVWDDYHREYSAQVVALARLISQRAMREHGLTLRKDGRVVKQSAEGKGGKTPRPAAIFPLSVGREEVRVEYTLGYFPNDDTALVYIVSPHEPPKAHPLSDAGYFSCFVPHDAVEACGGPEVYAALLAEAILRGKELPFIEAFEGPLPVTDPRRHRKEHRPAAEPGGHAEWVMAEEKKPQRPSAQGMLF